MSPFLFVVVVIALCSTYAQCWGIGGHVVTGELAQSYLSEEAQKMVQNILSKYEGPDGKTFTELGPLGPYADVLRKDYPWAVNYHFINVNDTQKSFVPKINCPDTHCLFGAINNYTKIMISPDSSDFAKGTALMFLTHFFGDMHQPLHVSHKSDKGGNDIKLQLSQDWSTKYRDSNLHHIWDSDMIYQFQQVEGKETPSDIVQYIKDNLVTDKALAKYMRVDDIVDVSDESLKLALEVAYARAVDLDHEDFPISYYDSVIPTILNQLMAGGLRLSAWLNKIASEVNNHKENHICEICVALSKLMSRLTFSK